MLLLYLLQSPLDLLAVVIGFLVVGITIHEFAHAYVADRFGDPTARTMGRVSLNPIAHLDPIGTIIFFIVGFGWGKPVPINPSFLNKKSDELKVAFAGIVANLAMATILAIPIRIATMQGVIIDTSPVLSVIDKIIDINIILASFNILPIPPLDGSHLIEYFLSEEQKLKFMFYGQYAILALIMFDLVSGYNIIYSIMEPLIRFFSLIVKGAPTTLF